MQIVINIDTVDYEYIKNGCIIPIKIDNHIYDAIRNGTPLPKGHGRLIDENALKTYIDNCDCCVGCEDESYGCADKCRCPDYLDEGMERIINNQPTIIEADKAESEVQT